MPYKDKCIVIELDKILYDQLYLRIDTFNVKKSYLFGLGNIKQVFWTGHYRALIPIIYKDFLNQDKMIIKNGFTSSKMTGYILNTYPYLKPMLLNLSKHYIDMRKEIEGKQLTDRVGYKELPDNPLKGFQKSTIIQLIEKMTEGLKITRDAQINTLHRKGKTQQQIASELKISQATVHRSIKRRGEIEKFGN